MHQWPRIFQSQWWDGVTGDTGGCVDSGTNDNLSDGSGRNENLSKVKNIKNWLCLKSLILQKPKSSKTLS